MKKAQSLVNEAPVSAGGVALGELPATSGTFSYDETAAGEQTVLDLTIAHPVRIGSIWLDLVNVTQNTTIRVYHAIDGTNRREFSTSAWVVADPDGVLVDGFTARSNVRITMQCGGGGAGSVDVPYAVV